MTTREVVAKTTPGSQTGEEEIMASRDEYSAYLPISRSRYVEWVQWLIMGGLAPDNSTICVLILVILLTRSFLIGTSEIGARVIVLVACVYWLIIVD